MRRDKVLGLEALRFASAMAVLLFHYRGFSYVANRPKGFVPEQQPLYSLFHYLYDYGNYGVPLFWCLSGFIFFRIYRHAVAEGAVSPRTFFVLRLSRLYPLHLATLLLVALLQALYVARNGYSFVYANNDARHFALQLFLAGSWGLERGYSFNAPVWSLSLEVPIYALFFVTLRYVGRSALVNVALVLLCLATELALGPSLLVRGVAYFYAGGLAAIALERCGSGRYRHLSVPRRVRNVIEATGNLTYASYLLHFPLQLAIALAYSWANRPIPYRDGTFFAAYVLTTLVASYGTYRLFELPVQRYLRQRWLPQPPGDERPEQTPPCLPALLGKHGGFHVG